MEEVGDFKYLDMCIVCPKLVEKFFDMIVDIKLMLNGDVC